MILLDKSGNIYSTIVVPLKGLEQEYGCLFNSLDYNTQGCFKHIHCKEEEYNGRQYDCFYKPIGSIPVQQLSDYSCDGPTWPYIKRYEEEFQRNGKTIYKVSIFAHPQTVLLGYLATRFGGANLYDLFLTIDTPFTCLDYRFDKSLEIPEYIAKLLNEKKFEKYYEEYYKWFTENQSKQRKINIEQGQKEYEEALRLFNKYKDTNDENELQQFRKELNDRWPSFAGFIFNFLQCAAFVEYNNSLEETSERLMEAQNNQTVLELAYQISALFKKKKQKFMVKTINGPVTLNS